MSLNKFSELFLNLDSNNSTNKKIEILKNYFSTNDVCFYLISTDTICFGF